MKSSICLKRYTKFDEEVTIFDRWVSKPNHRVVALVFSSIDRIGFTSRLKNAGLDASEEHDSDAHIIVLDPDTLVLYTRSTSLLHSVVVCIGPDRLWRTVLGLNATNFDKDDDMGPFPCEKPERSKAFFELLDGSCKTCMLMEWQSGCDDDIGAQLVEFINAQRRTAPVPASENPERNAIRLLKKAFSMRDEIDATENDTDYETIKRVADISTTMIRRAGEVVFKTYGSEGMWPFVQKHVPRKRYPDVDLIWDGIGDWVA